MTCLNFLGPACLSHLLEPLWRYRAFRLSIAGVFAIGIIALGSAMASSPELWDDPKVRTFSDVLRGLGVIVAGCGAFALAVYIDFSTEPGLPSPTRLEFPAEPGLPSPTRPRLFQGSPGRDLAEVLDQPPAGPDGVGGAAPVVPAIDDDLQASLLRRLTACLEPAPINREELRSWLDVAQRSGSNWRGLYEEAVQRHLFAHPEQADLIPAAEEVAP
jgi:hypothetical protein